MRPIKPRRGESQGFHYSVYKRLEKWKNGKKIEMDLDYAPNIGDKKTGTFRPDIILDISRDPSEVEYFGGPDNTIDKIEEYFREGKKFKIKVILDATMWKGQNTERWSERIERMNKYVAIAGREEWVTDVIPVVVMPKGWDQSLDHGIEGEIHVLSFDIIEEYMDNLLESTIYFENREALQEILFSKYDECPDCESKEMSYIPLHSCSFSTGEYNNVSADTTFIFDELCAGCDQVKYGCDGLYRKMKVICHRCGWVKNDKYHRLNPCSYVQILGFYTEECDDCGEPHKCNSYKRLVEEGKIIDKNKPKNTSTTIDDF